MMSNANHGEEKIFPMTGQASDQPGDPMSTNKNESEDIEPLLIVGTESWFLRHGPKLYHYSTWDIETWNELPEKPEGALPSISGKQMLLVRKL